MTWTLQLAGVHLVNQGGAPLMGGSPLIWHTTPFAVLPGWTANPAKPNVTYTGASPLSSGSRPVLTVYDNVPETIPINVIGNDGADVADALQLLKQELSAASYSRPAIWRHRPVGVSFDLYAEVYEGSVEEKTNAAVGPIEGGANIEAEISLVRSPFFGADELIDLISAESYTNGPTGNVIMLGSFVGDLQVEGQPLNIRIAKPTAQAGAEVLLASVASVSARTINQSQSTTTSATYTTSSAIDVAALRDTRSLSLRILGRFHTLTLPALAEVQATVKTAAGNTLWTSLPQRLGSDVTAQLIDFGDAPLEQLRLPVISTAALNITITITIRSTTGATVVATLDYIEALLAHDFCIVKCAAGLSSGQHYDLFGAQNLSGGGWLPMVQEEGGAFDGSDVQTNSLRILGQLPRAFRGASLYAAWREETKAHTKTDAAVITASMAPLWRTLRGVA